MSGPGLKRKGAAQTRRYVASQNVDVTGDNEEAELNSNEGSRPSVRRRIITSSTLLRSPITRSQTRSRQPSPVRLTSKLREMVARSPNAHVGPNNEVRSPVSASSPRTNDIVVGENTTQAEESGPTPISGEQGSSQGSEPHSSLEKKIRGPTRGIGLEKLTKAKGKKLAITVSPNKGRPTDPIESAKLSSEIGLMVRHHLPKNTKFKDITEGVIEESLSRVEARFDIHLSQPQVKRVVIGIMKDRNRGERCKLHKYFKSFPSAEEVRKKPPKDMDITKWNEHCLEVNKKNRGNNHWRVKTICSLSLGEGDTMHENRFSSW